MARYEHLRIFQCAYDLVVEIYKITKNFNREYKYTLGEKLKESSHELLDIIRKVNSLPNKEKTKYFEMIDFKKENLRIYLRIACELKLISVNRLGLFNESIEEIGRQLGGWQKYVLNKVD